MEGTRLSFEDHVLDTARRELRRGDELVPLEPQVFDLLVYVIRNRDRVVSKDDLVEAVWSGRAISDSTLTTRINAMRKALGDSGEEQRLIRTVARKGIRFVGNVTEETRFAVPTLISDVAEPMPLPDKPSIAVLPFQNLSGDPEQEYFSDGLTDDIITALSKWRWFLVIARNSSFTFKGRAVDIKLIGRELGARYVLEGSVRKLDKRVRVSAQLIEAQNGAHIWAQRYDRNIVDVFDVQDEIASQIARALDVELTEAEGARRARERPGNPAAQDLVLRARALQNDIRGRTRAQIATTRRFLLDAIKLDDTAHGLYPELSRTYLNEAVYGWAVDYDGTLRDAETAADRALALYPKDAAAHVSRGVAYRMRGDMEKALGSFRIALDLNPNYANAMAQLADTLTQTGQVDEGYETCRRALRLDPLFPNNFRYLARACLHAGRYHEAADWFRKAIQIAPNLPWVCAQFAASLALSDRMDEARRVVREMIQNGSITSLRDYKKGDVPGSPHWEEQKRRTYAALLAAGLPE